MSSESVFAPAWDTRRAEATSWSAPPLPTVVVVPHPDDEVLMFGGLIARQVAAGVSVTLLAVTDGDASHQVDRAALASRRRDEQDRAITRLADGDSGAVQVTRLGVPDGHAGDDTAALARALDDLCGPNTLLAAPWHRDHHSDHEAIGLTASAAAARAQCLAVGAIFWGWQHRSPADLDGAALVALELYRHERLARAEALACHRSQTTAMLGAPVVSPHDLTPLTWAQEYYVSTSAS